MELSPFAHEVILYLLKIALAGIGLLTALAVGVQLFFRKAITHEAKKGLLKKRLNDDDMGAKRLLLERFEKDLENLRRSTTGGMRDLQQELEENRRALAQTTHSNAEMSREHRYLHGKLSEVLEELAQLRKVQPKFLSQMTKFISELGKMRAMQQTPIPKSGGLVKVSTDTGEDPS